MRSAIDHRTTVANPSMRHPIKATPTVQWPAMPRVSPSTHSNDRTATDAEQTLGAAQSYLEQTLGPGIKPSAPSASHPSNNSPLSDLPINRPTQEPSETLSAQVDETQRSGTPRISGTPRVNSSPLSRPSSPPHSSETSARPQPLAQDARQPLPTGAQRYVRQETLGQGGCGIVYRAFDRQLQRDVVVKQILPGSNDDEQIRHRFWHEAMITGSLEHPGIAPVYEAGQDEASGESFYAMKWLKGQTLHDAIEQLHRTTNRQAWKHGLRELLERFVAVCQTLAYAHENNVIHRDIKAANIMLGAFGETVVLDWGIAKRLPPSQTTGASAETHGTTCALQANSVASSQQPAAFLVAPLPINDLTCQGDLVGTPSAMSPEQAQGQTESLDHRTDLFSLGSLLYEILTGTSAFRCADPQQTLEQVRTGRYTPCRSVNRKVPRPLASICERSLQVDPDRRFQSAGEFANEIKRYLSGERVSVHAESWWEAIDRLARKHRNVTWTIIASLAVLAVGATIALSLVHHAQQNEARAHTQTLGQLSASRQASDQWLIGISGDLQFYPGLEELRSELLVKAQAHYEQLVQAPCVTPQQSLENAKARIRLADLHQLQDARDRATEQFEQALQLLTKIEPRLSPELQRDVQLQRANALIGMAISAAASTTRDSLLLEAQEHLTQLAPTDCNGEVANASVRCSLLVARSLSERFAYDRAIEQLESIEPLALQLHVQHSDARHRHLYATLLKELSQLHYVQKHYQEAALVDQTLIEVFDQALSEGTRADWLEERAMALVHQGNCWLQLGETLSARAAYEQAIDDYQAAWQSLYGQAYYSESLGTVLANISMIEAREGMNELAEAHLREGIDWLREAIEFEGVTPDRVERMTRCYLSLALLLDRNDSEREALLRQAKTLLVWLEENEHAAETMLELQQQWDRAHATDTEPR